MVLKVVFDRISLLFAVLATIAIVLTMFTTIIDILARVLKIPVIGVFELNSLLVGMCIYLAIAFTQAEGKNITVRLLTDRLPKHSKAMLEFAPLVACAIMFGWTTCVYYNATYNALVRGEVAQGVSDFPLFPLKMVMFLGVSMLTLQLVIDIVIRVRHILHRMPDIAVGKYPAQIGEID